VGAGVAHHRANRADEQPPEQEPQYAPAPADPSDQIEHLAELHTSGALTDEEFAAAKAKVLGS
jgi:Short C-terminal domain